ncbi:MULTISPECIES: copper chaperone [unclassified Spirosoma]|uniref:heavy-metal-associated domain-containing protein n=1 Tax=unclassified Spirosoma TaxID=2621999 RepID=UPI000966C215|nr:MULTISPECIES: copper chaperone [unclassified Spirosoma]MBN8821339.1 copper chaperone [Spirosoma sp.]OJW78129.1 MAG: hypothetical protein BGO59_29355 [Spirosoma sp. 48-14]
METLNFKTNLMTSDDVAAVNLNLNDIEPVDGWNIDPNGLLTVQTTDNRIAEQVIRAVEQAGYWAEILPV